MESYITLCDEISKFSFSYSNGISQFPLPLLPFNKKLILHEVVYFKNKAGFDVKNKVQKSLLISSIHSTEAKYMKIKSKQCEIFKEKVSVDDLHSHLMVMQTLRIIENSISVPMDTLRNICSK
jgi:hypothetical protein